MSQGAPGEQRAQLCIVHVRVRQPAQPADRGPQELLGAGRVADLVGDRFSSWEAALRALAALATDEPLLVVIEGAWFAATTIISPSPST